MDRYTQAEAIIDEMAGTIAIPVYQGDRSQIDVVASCITTFMHGVNFRQWLNIDRTETKAIPEIYRAMAVARIERRASGVAAMVAELKGAA